MYRKYYSYNDMPMINNLAENTGRNDIGRKEEAEKKGSEGRAEKRGSERYEENAVKEEIIERPAEGVRLKGNENGGKIFGKFENDDILLLVVIFILLADGCDDDLLIIALAAVFLMGK